MGYNPEIHKRKSIRLAGYDYSKEGMYFITICTHNREHLLGEIVGARCTCPNTYNKYPNTYSCTCSDAINQMCCDKNKEIEPKIILNELGKIVEKEILNTNKMRKNINIEEFVIMPNHIHFIVEILDDFEIFKQGHVQRAPTVEKFGKPTKNTIPTIVRLLKSTITKQINVIRKMDGIPVWQRNYYENIIRNEGTYLKVSEYIKNNPLKWEEDKYFAD